MVEIRELLSLPESPGGLTDADVTVNKIGQLLNADRLGHGSGTDTLSRAPALELDSVRSVLESGGIAKLYCEHPDGVRTSPVASFSDWTAETDEMSIHGVCLVREFRPGSRRYSIVRLAADGSTRDRTGIKLRLVREVLADLHGIRGVISANLSVDDASGGQALRACAFMPQAGRVLASLPLPARLPSTRPPASISVRADLSESEQSWQNLLHSIGCSLPATSTDAARSPQSETVSLTATSQQGVPLAAMTLRQTGANEASITRLECDSEEADSALATLVRSAEGWCHSRRIGLLHAELCASRTRQLTALRSLGFVSVAHYLSFARRL